MKYISLHLICLLVLLAFAAKAQVTTPQFNAMALPPPPNAASLGKYGETPVNLYSGIPSIEVPLLPLKFRNITLPVSISYHASGIKVGQQASQVGLGWVLNAGGCISRTVMGLPDEDINGLNALKTRGGGLPMKYAGKKNGDGFLLNCGLGRQDTESDFYFFNFAGRSGKFIYFDSVFITMPYSKLNIFDVGYWGKAIIDENGYRYDFNVTESVSSNSSSGEESKTAIQSWYINKIISPDNTDSILFTYEDYQYNVYNREEQETKKIRGINVDDELLPPHIDEQIMLTQLINGKLLRKITGLDYIVQLYYSDRSDLEDKKLDSVVYTDKYSNRIKKYAFSYSYFNVDNALRLDSLTETGNDNSISAPYRFYYLKGDQLPDGFSKSKDHWGYNNGATNTTLIPEIITIDGYHKLANRESSPQYAPIGMLSRIQYPTGGYTDYEFELNTYSYLRDSILPTQFMEVDTAASAELWNLNVFESKTTTATFKISKPQFVKVSYRVSNCMIDQPGCQSYNGDVSQCTTEIRAPDNTVVWHYSWGKINEIAHGTKQVFLQPGIYKIIIQVQAPYDQGNVSVSYNAVTNRLLPRKKYGSGVRIARMNIFDGVDKKHVITKRYNYDFPGDTISSGVIMTKPRYDYMYDQFLTLTEGEIPCKWIYPYYCYTSFSNLTLGLSNNTVGYAKVTEYLDSLDNNSRIENYFTTAIEFPDTIQIEAPFPPPTSYEWRRGLLKGKMYFSGNGKLLQKEIKNYKFSRVPGKVATCLKTFQSVYCAGSPIMSDGTYAGILYTSAYYNHHVEWLYLESDTTSYYSTDGLSTLNTSTSYTYDSTSLNPATITRTKSDGRKFTEYYSYPFNYKIAAGAGNSLAAGILSLQQKGIRAPVIEKFVKTTNSTISGLLVSYKLTQPYPDSVFQLETSVPLSDFTQAKVLNNNLVIDKRYRPLMIFDRYDNKGNVIQQHRYGNMPETFIWGYDATYPVARIQGETFDKAMSFINPVLLSGLPADQTLRTELQKIRTGLHAAHATVETFTYRPLMGITSVTDASGKVTYYEYDAFGRLKLIRDDTGKILKQIEYQYQQPFTR